MTLYEIEQEMQMAIEAMLDSVNEETGEVDEEMARAIEDLQLARAEKLESIGCYIKNLDAEVEAIKAEKKKLEERAKVKENRLARLKDYVANNLVANNELKFDSPRVSYSFRKSEQVDIRDIDKIPEEYTTKVTEIKPDKTAIKKAIKDGIAIDGALLIQKMNLQIK